MGLRDRLKGLVRGVASGPAGSRAAERPMDTAGAGLVDPAAAGSGRHGVRGEAGSRAILRFAAPSAVASPPSGALLLDVGRADATPVPGARRIPTAQWPDLRGPVCVVGGEPLWAAAVAERLSALGVHPVSWVPGALSAAIEASA